MPVLRLGSGGLKMKEIHVKYVFQEHLNHLTNIYCAPNYVSDFSGGSVVKNLPGNAGDSGDMGLIPGSGQSLGKGNGNLC